MRSSARVVCLLLLAATLIAAGGCKRSVVVKGKLTRHGAPYTVDDKKVVYVCFIPYGERAQPDRTFGTRVRQDGTFEVAGAQGKGIPTGKYEVTIGEDKIRSQRPKKPAGLAITTTREVTPKQEIEIDVDRPD